ncbi:hypothetical protein [Mycobacterium sp. OTB74]|uniref:hypothetical protein n=1 Tax=Mycobacterium sp. OTB74 TaxID=1853452 RepID=UPI0024736092|nr:hypothetical protein [Mycobacterium sp. OTB74]MDH6245516.1 hypothetical protein [Mycobacterium sp. OTB74]
MTIQHVLADGVASATWPAIRAVVFTTAGVVLIVIGSRRLVVRRRWERADEQRLLHPDVSDVERAPAPLKGGGLLVWGAVLFLLGLGHILDLIVTLHLAGVL